MNGRLFLGVGFWIAGGKGGMVGFVYPASEVHPMSISKFQSSRIRFAFTVSKVRRKRCRETSFAECFSAGPNMSTWGLMPA